jgi:hypothetical protein
MARRRRRTASAYERARRQYAPGQGGRFRALVQDLQSRGYSAERARRIAAAIGRRKYGARQMARWAAAGRRRRARRRAA